MSKSSAIKDSILQSTPLLSMNCTDLKGSTTSIKAFLKEMQEKEFDYDGKLIIYDPDRMFAEINGSGELVTIQYYVFDKLFLGLNDFIQRSGKN